MRLPEFTLTLFLVNRKLDECTFKKIYRQFFYRCGFEIIFNKTDDINYSFKDIFGLHEEFDDWFIALDLFPWTNVKCSLQNIEWDKNSDNHRIEWSVFTVKRFLAEQLCNKQNNHLKGILLPDEPFDYFANTSRLFKAFEEYYPDIADQINKKTIKFHCKFKIIKQLTDYGCNNRIDLVEYENQIMICKTFKPDRISFFKNEIIARKNFHQVINIPKIIIEGNNYLLIEYLKSSKPLTSLFNNYKLLKIRTAKRIILDLKCMFSKGFINLDFHPGNILVSNEQDLWYIDFEYLLQHNNDFSFLNNPGIIKHDKYLFNSPLSHITYKNYWEPIIKINLKILLYAPLPILLIFRAFTILKIILLKYSRKAMRKLDIKNSLQVFL